MNKNKLPIRNEQMKDDRNVFVAVRTGPINIPTKLPNEKEAKQNHHLSTNANENQTRVANPIDNVNFSGVDLMVPSSTLGGSYGFVMRGNLT
jgi:hypothetical protein